MEERIFRGEGEVVAASRRRAPGGNPFHEDIHTDIIKT